jgi:hypothetical protein
MRENQSTAGCLFLSLVALVAVSAAPAAVPDVTASLEYLFAPMESRYGTSTNSLTSRAVHCLEYLDGRIYVGGGDWDANSGPVPIVSVLPGAAPTWTNEYSAGTEHIEAYKKFSDGRIWTRATDPKEGQPNYGHFFAKYPGGDWVRCPLGSIDWNPAHQLTGAELYTHAWDFCDYKGDFYFTGYGIGGSAYWLNGDDTFANKMGSVTTGQTNGYYRYVQITGQTGNTYQTAENLNLERFMTLMPFDNGCIALPWHWYESRQPDLNPCYFWRRDAATGKFAREDCPWETFLGGYEQVDRELVSSGSYGWWIYLRKAMPYKGRVYYIVTPGCSMNAPMGFFSATMDASGGISSQRHAFDSGHGHVIDIAVVGGSLYVMTVRRDSATSIVHGIWKSTDGQAFAQLATFTSDQYFESFTYAKGSFYLGYGHAGIGSWAVCAAQPAVDKAGQIWRFALPQADDDGANDSEVVTPQRVWDFANAPWYWGELGVTNVFVKGVTGKGVKVGVVDAGIQPVTVDGVAKLTLDHHAGATGQGAEHGIAVASIIKSETYGISPDCELYAYNGTSMVDDIKGIWWCLTNGCKVVNLSGGYTPFDYTEAQLAWAQEQIRTMVDDYGLVLVLAGGNAPNETLAFPQDMEGVVNITGITRERTSAGFNDNWSKDFCAFGTGIPAYVNNVGGTSSSLGGSSYAAPMATAICALYLQQNPTLTKDELYGILKTNCIQLSEDRSRIFGWGLLQAGTIPSSYKRQAEYDAEKAAWVKAAGLALGNNGLVWNDQYSRYEIKMYPGEMRTLKCTVAPANASDTNAYWYCGNMPTFSPIGLDNVLAVPSTTAAGKFLVYECRNVEREILGRLRVDVVAQGSESAADVPPAEESDPSDPTDPVDPVDPAEPEEPAFTPTNSWFTVDCLGAIFAAPTNYAPTVVGFCESNAYIEVEMTVTVLNPDPEPAADEKSSLYLASDDDGGNLRFRVLSKEGWTDVANADLAPTSGLVRRIRIELEKGTAEARRVRYAVDGKVLSASGTEWFDMRLGGDVRSIEFLGDADILTFFGEFCNGFSGAAKSLAELLGGKIPVIASGGTAADRRPGFAVSGGTVTASVPETVSGVYYTAFASATLDRRAFRAVESKPGTGAALSFTLDVGETPSQFLLIVASVEPIASGTPLE